ncbi:MAG: PP2C family protein-serine/threonine phosphatase [Candidatus Competibacterales bacterium]
MAYLATDDVHPPSAPGERIAIVVGSKPPPDLTVQLQGLGFHSTVVDPTSAGLCILEQSPPPTLLLWLKDDLGVDATLHTTLGQFSHLPIVVVAAQATVADAVATMKAGAWDYLAPPVTSASLANAIHHTLARAADLERQKHRQQQLETTVHSLQVNLQRLREDEEAGRRLQFQLLPKNHTIYQDLRFSYKLVTSSYLSGDFVDFFAIDDDHVGFYIADVSGHGVPSSFVTVLLKSYMSRYLELYRQGKSQGILNPAKILSRLNHNVLGGELGKYLTMFYGVIQRSTQTLSYSNGGHFPLPLLYDGRRSTFVGDKSPPVGLFDFAEYANHDLTLPSHFAMVLLSDGVLEILPQAKLQAKLGFLLSITDDVDIDIEALLTRVGLCPSATPPDDVTLLLVKRES